jgi:hypothetical protein
VTAGISSPNIVSLTAQGTDVYAATASSGVFYSSNKGATWTLANKGNSVSVVAASVLTAGAAPAPDFRKVYYGTSDGGAFQTTNQGLGWANLNNGAVYDFQYNFHKP